MKYYNYKRIASGQGGAAVRARGRKGERQAATATAVVVVRQATTTQQNGAEQSTAPNQTEPQPQARTQLQPVEYDLRPARNMFVRSRAKREKERARCKCACVCVCAAAGIRDNLDAFTVISLETGLMCGRSMFDCSSTGSLQSKASERV